MGKNEDVLLMRGPDTQIFDANGHFVVPGFTDSHVHFLLGGLSLLEVDLQEVTGRNDFEAEMLKNHSALPEGSWMRGGLWDNSKWDTPELPDRTWMDNVCPERPVYLMRQDLHMGLANGKALEIAGINRDTPDPDGGRIDRDPVTGEPSGILRDAAMRLVEETIPEYDSSVLIQAVRAACAEASKNGITGVHDMPAFDDVNLLSKISGEEYFNLRYRAFPPIRFWKEVLEIQKEQRDSETSGTPLNLSRFRVAGVKAFTDGSLGSRTALFFESYSDAPGEYGLPNDIMFPEGNLLRLAGEADAVGLQMVIHAIGDRANSDLLDMYDVIIKKNGKRDRRWRIEHAQHVRKKDFNRFRELEVIASVQPFHCVDDARWAEKRIGSERCRTSFAFRSFLDKNVPVVFGTDWTVAPLNPIYGIDAAVNRVPAREDSPWYPEQRLSVEEALKAYTVTPHYSVFDENLHGAIAPGKAADCAVLSADLLNIPPEEIKNTTVLCTIFNGKIVYRNGI